MNSLWLRTDQQHITELFIMILPHNFIYLVGDINSKHTPPLRKTYFAF